MINTTVGNFQIIAHLGKGGMGEVWLAQQPNLKTKVAIKILAAEISQNQTDVKRFHNEAFAVGQIPHSGIVRIFDGAFLPDGRAYLVMEYLQGETLASRIKRMGRLELPLIADFGRQIASVLDATHHAGITHRDLKPDNIYLVRDAELAHGERIKILDFGIAKLDTTVGPRMTAMTASSIGTPLYMSPEQWHSLADAGAPTDAYALGCVAFEMACGRPPFVGSSRVEVCAMHLDSVPPVPSSLARGIPAEFDRLIARLLEKEPANRPPMREAIAVFTALGQGQGVALSTLPPNSISPFAASAESSMQYRMTPRSMASAEFSASPPSASLQYGNTAPAPGERDNGDRDDATPVAGMSLQFKPTPPAGFESQTGMRAATDPAAKVQSMVVKKSRVGLFVAAGLVVATAIAIAIAVTRSPSSSGGGSQASGSAPGSGTAIARGSGSAAKQIGSGSAAGSNIDNDVAETGSGGPNLRRLPPRKDPVTIPEVATALKLVVCIDTDGEVESVTLADNGGLPPKAVDAAVSSWEYVPYRGRGGVVAPICGQVTIPPRAKGPAVTPTKLTKKLFNDGVGGINEGIFKCSGFARGGGTFTVTVAVSPAGIGTLKMIAVTSGRPRLDRLKACIEDEIKNVRFTKTKQGGGGSTTVQLN